MPVQCSTNELSKPHESGRMRVSPLYVDVILGVQSESNFVHSSNSVMTVINARAAVTLLEQRPEKIQALSGIRTHDLCNASAVLYQ